MTMGFIIHFKMNRRDEFNLMGLAGWMRCCFCGIYCNTINTQRCGPMDGVIDEDV